VTGVAAPLLRASGLVKAYDGVHALRGASLELRSGEVHALVGENGAGKSTLIKILTGAVEPDDGTIELDGAMLEENSPARAKALGIAAIYQQPALFPDLTVAENLALGVEQTTRWGRVDWRARRRRAVALLEKVGCRIDPDTDAADLSMPEQQLVEIARAIGADAQVLILDEPTASLGEADARNVHRVLRGLRANGVGMIYISHRLEELSTIADRVTVLRDGCTIATLDMVDVTRERLIQLMVGRDVAEVFPKQSVPPGETILEVRRLGCKASALRDVSLSVRAGEIVGVAGLMGAGRTELARCLFGLTPADTGEIVLRGERIEVTSPARAIDLGIAYLPEDRRRHGVVLPMAVDANMSLAREGSRTGASSLGTLDRADETRIAGDLVERLGVKTASLHALVQSLSGGNQQKVALARWLATVPSLLILDEPTQGVDVGAKAEIHALMGELAARGVAILMISSELPEIIAMSDRIVVMRDGMVFETIERAEASPERIIAGALGESSEPPVLEGAASS
jgi:rhamnose transport system ATP-binding protein